MWGIGTWVGIPGTTLVTSALAETRPVTLSLREETRESIKSWHCHTVLHKTAVTVRAENVLCPLEGCLSQLHSFCLVLPISVGERGKSSLLTQVFVLVAVAASLYWTKLCPLTPFCWPQTCPWPPGENPNLILSLSHPQHPANTLYPLLPPPASLKAAPLGLNQSSISLHFPPEAVLVALT